MSTMQRLSLFITPPHDCSYLPKATARMVFVDPAQSIGLSTLSDLSRQGFRRSGDFIYRPQCKHCTQCLSVRIPVASFNPNRSQKRVLKKNTDIEVRLTSLTDFNHQHYQLYAKYINQRHADGDMYPPSEKQFEKFILQSCVNSFFIEFWLKERLVAVALCDSLDDGLSAVYTFFDPTLNHRSLGTLAILQQISLVQAHYADYVYLGYWVANSVKMAYKSNFAPFEVFANDHWHRIEHSPKTEAEIEQIQTLIV